MSYCPKCGKQVKEVENFCRACGYNLKDTQSEQPQLEAKGQPSKCSIHSTRDSVGICANCGKTVCDLCRTVSGGKLLCPACIGRVISKSTEKVVTSIKGISKPDITSREEAVMAPRKTQQVRDETLTTENRSKRTEDVRKSELPTLRRKSWFQRHIDWTVALTFLLPNILAIVLGSLVSEELAYGIALLGSLLLMLVTGWALKQVQRKLWWLLLFFVPLGLLFVTGLVMLEGTMLTSNQMKAGLYLEREGGFLNLMRDGVFLTTFPRQGITKRAIRQEAQKYI